MNKKSNTKVPADIKIQVEELVTDFNKKNQTDYVARFRGIYVYFDRVSMRGPVFRLKFSGDVTQWDFAIYKYSSESYDPNEWVFPGSELVNGTVEGAMKAGLQAYPV